MLSNKEEDGITKAIVSAIFNILYLIAVYMVVSAWKDGRRHNECLGIVVIIVMVLSLIGLLILAFTGALILSVAIAAANIPAILVSLIIFLYLIIGVVFVFAYF